MPKRYKRAGVVSIHKRGRPQELDNYRPVSLLTAMDKVYAVIITTTGLLRAMDAYLRGTQYGFQPARSTTQPVLCVHRVLNYLGKKQGSG